MFYKSICLRRIGNKTNGSSSAYYRCFQKFCPGSGSPPFLTGLPACTLTPLQSISHPVATMIFLKGKSNIVSVLGKVVQSFFACFEKNLQLLIWALLWAPVCALAQPHGSSPMDGSANLLSIPGGSASPGGGTGCPFACDAFASVSHPPNSGLPVKGHLFPEASSESLGNH